MRRKKLSAAEKVQVLEQRSHCFICDKLISRAELPTLAFDHIRSLHAEGSNELTNYAAVHKECHLGKGTKSLEDYKEELRLDRVFNGLVTFEDVSQMVNPCQEKLGLSIDYRTREITFGDGSKAPLWKCPNTGLEYFYHPVSRKYLQSDVEVQPRGLEQKRLRNLALNLRRNFQLSPTVCRLVTAQGVIKVFDGQHKATAQALGNNNELVDCKVFIDPPLEMVRRVVVEGHGPLRQQEFKTSELYKKLTANFLEQLSRWQDGHPDRTISEAELPQALGRTKEEVCRDLVARITESILEDADCDMSAFVSKERRAGDKPLSYDMFAWWVKLLIKDPPVPEPMDSEQNLREVERQNAVRFFNLVSRSCLEGKWTPENPDSVEYRKTRRLFYRASFREWTRLLAEAFRIILFLRPDEAVFYRGLSPDYWQRFENAVEKLRGHPVWMDPNPLVESTLNSNIQKNVSRLFADMRLNPEHLCTP